MADMFPEPGTLTRDDVLRQREMDGLKNAYAKEKKEKGFVRGFLSSTIFKAVAIGAALSAGYHYLPNDIKSDFKAVASELAHTVEQSIKPLPKVNRGL